MKTHSLRSFSLLSTAALSLSLLLACGSTATNNTSGNDAGTNDAGTDSGTSGERPVSQCAALKVATERGTYESPTFVENTKREFALRAQYKKLSDRMKEAEADPKTKPATLAELTTLWAEGSPSLKSVTSQPIAARVEVALQEFVDAQGQSYAPADPPPATGGKFGKYLFNAKGVDLRQQVEKLLYGALFFREAQTIAQGPLNGAAVDQILALFGGNPALLGDDKAMANADVLAALYSERRDKKDAKNPGLYLRFRSAAIRTQAAASSPEENCKSDAKEGVAEMFSLWEQSVDATCIYYMLDSTAKFDSPDDTTRGDALHAYGEVIAFLEGFTDAKGKKTPAQITEALQNLKAAPAVEGYKVLLSPGTVAATFRKTIDQLAQIHAFSSTDVEGFRVNN
jgi:hypothetical protein